MTIPTRQPAVIEQDDALLDSAQEHLERAIKVLARIRSHPVDAPDRVALRERSTTIYEVTRAAYASICEVEWRAGIPSEATMEWVREQMRERGITG